MATDARSNRRATDRARVASASRLSVVTSTSRLRSKSRASSSRRLIASRARSRATVDRLLATRLTARNANSATQFCGSATTNVPTGGRKTKLKVSIAAMEIVTATHSGELAATSRTTISNAVATVVALAPGSQRVKIDRHRGDRGEPGGEPRRVGRTARHAEVMIAPGPAPNGTARAPVSCQRGQAPQGSQGVLRHRELEARAAAAAPPSIQAVRCVASTRR